MDQPEFQAPVLAALAAAFCRRAKAIRYHGNISLAREIDADDERLNFDYTGTSKLHLRLSVWSTGDLWFLACQRGSGRNGGWRFKYQVSGQVADRPPASIVESFEASMLVGHWYAGEQLSKLQKIWQAIVP